MSKLKSKGALFIEFAVILPIFLLLLFNIIFGAIMLYDYNSAQEFVRIRARHLSATMVDEAVTTTNSVTTITYNGGGEYAQKEKQNLQELLDRRMLMYKVDTSYFNDTDKPIQLFIRQGKEDTTLNDGEIWLQVMVQIYKPDDAVPFIASVMCPQSFVIQQLARLEKY